MTDHSPRVGLPQVHSFLFLNKTAGLFNHLFWPAPSPSNPPPFPPHSPCESLPRGSRTGGVLLYRTVALSQVSPSATPRAVGVTGAAEEGGRSWSGAGADGDTSGPPSRCGTLEVRSSGRTGLLGRVDRTQGL